MQRHRKGKLLIVATMVAMAIPFLFWVKFPALDGWGAQSLTRLATYGALLSGFVGTVVLLWQYILGSRTMSAHLTTDLQWSIGLHKNLGIYGTLLIFLHPLLIMYSYGEDFLYTIVPNVSSTFEYYVTLGRFAFIILLIIWATSALLRGKIKYRPWKYIHYLTYVLLPFSLLHAPPIGTTLNNSPLVLAYWYGLSAVFIFVTLLRIRSLFGYGKQPYEITLNQQVARDIFLIRLKPLGRILTPTRGQFLYLQNSFKRSDHPFSVLGYSATNGTVDIAYKVVGSETEFMSSLTKGNITLIDGPYGTFTAEVNEASVTMPSVFIAGGIGITPFIRHLCDRRASQHDWLFYCTPTEDDIIVHEPLKASLGERYINVFSKASTSKTGTEAGYFNAEMVGKYINDPTHFHYFVCGSKRMMEQVIESLRNMGISKSHIHTEEFSN